MGNAATSKKGDSAENGEIHTYIDDDKMEKQFNKNPVPTPSIFNFYFLASLA
jgi:hypothetical protein